MIKVTSLYISIAGINQEGIFRLNGNVTRRRELENTFYHNLPLNLDQGNYSVHDCANVLKKFLSDLPEPLLTDAYFQIYWQIAGKNLYEATYFVVDLISNWVII